MSWLPVTLDLPVPVAVLALLALPAFYVLLAYGYVARWHKRLSLWSTIIHENGRLSLRGSLLYFDHFIGCVPMVVFFALCSAGAAALYWQAPPSVEPTSAGWLAGCLLSASLLLVAASFLASVRTVGWQSTIDYALQRIERDGVQSRGGTWHQLQLSNVPIAIGMLGVASMVRFASPGLDVAPDGRLVAVGALCLGLAVVLGVGISFVTWCGWRSLRNARWLAHSIREIATYPLTAVPLALASIVLVEHALSGTNHLVLGVGPLSIMLLGLCVGAVVLQLALLRGADVLAMAQKPAYASEGLSVPYLLAAHVFEHFLDFVLIGALSGGLYAALRWWALNAG